jgi:hypothetical protein
VLDYPLDAAGILAAFPYILMAVVVQVGVFTFVSFICLSSSIIRPLVTYYSFLST